MFIVAKSELRDWNKISFSKTCSKMQLMKTLIYHLECVVTKTDYSTAGPLRISKKRNNKGLKM